jgi:hypothetical protein
MIIVEIILTYNIYLVKVKAHRERLSNLFHRMRASFILVVIHPSSS